MCTGTSCRDSATIAIFRIPSGRRRSAMVAFRPSAWNALAPSPRPSPRASGNDAMSAPPPSTRNGALVFGDARICKEWLNALPLGNIPQAQTLVLEALRALNGAEFDSLERLKCLELIRDKVA